MPGDAHYRKLENMYRGAPCNEYYSPRMTITEGAAALFIPVEGKFFHSGGAVHGSVYFKVLDDAAYFAASSLVDDLLLLTVQFTLHLTAPISGGSMRAVGRVVRNAGRFITAEANLYDDAGTEIARGSGMFMKGGTLLSPEIGYQ